MLLWEIKAKFISLHLFLKIMLTNLCDSNEIRTHNHLVHKWTLNHLAKLVKWLSCVLSTYMYAALDCMSVYQREYTLYSCLNVKELLVRNRYDVCSLSDSKDIRTHNHLVHKQTLSHLAKLAKWLRFVVSTYPYGALDCMLLSCHIHVSEWIYTL